MRRLAFFVEGYTELCFIEKLVVEIAGQDKVLVKSQQIRGKGSKRKISIVRNAARDIGQQYYVLIMDCGADNAVRQCIQDEHASLSKQNYAEVIGIRDVRPTYTRTDIPRLRQSMRTGIKTSLAPVSIILSVMEIEAWFLAETNHYQCISVSLTSQLIASQLGFDPPVDDMSLRNTPASDLNDAYNLVGQVYDKTLAQRTVGVLDYTNLYFSVRSRFTDLDNLINRIDHFFS